MGGVIYIGDRETGKTHLALELTNKNSEYVRVTSPDYNTLKLMLWDNQIGKIRATSDQSAVRDQPMEVKVQLVTGEKVFYSSWLDTPGEIWRSSWQSLYPDNWQTFLNSIRDAEGILLVLPPYREIINPQYEDPMKHISRHQWNQRFERWINFFKQDCQQIRHLLLCINKVDLCMVDYKAEAEKLRYDPYKQSKNWQQKHEYVYQRYFAPFHPQIDELNRSIKGLSARCFITTIHSRELLELPWIYLGSHLAKDIV